MYLLTLKSSALVRYQQRLRAEEILIPHLHKAQTLAVTLDPKFQEPLKMLCFRLTNIAQYHTLHSIIFTKINNMPHFTILSIWFILSTNLFSQSKSEILQKLLQTYNVHKTFNGNGMVIFKGDVSLNTGYGLKNI